MKANNHAGTVRHGALRQTMAKTSAAGAATRIRRTETAARYLNSRPQPNSSFRIRIGSVCDAPISVQLRFHRRR